MIAARKYDNAAQACTTIKVQNGYIYLLTAKIMTTVAVKVWIELALASSFPDSLDFQINSSILILS